MKLYQWILLQLGIRYLKRLGDDIVFKTNFELGKLLYRIVFHLTEIVRPPSSPIHITIREERRPFPRHANYAKCHKNLSIIIGDIEWKR